MLKNFTLTLQVLLILLIGLSTIRAETTTRASGTTPEEVLLQEKGGILLPKGQLVVEPGFQYSHTSRARIAISGFTILEAIVIGEITTEDIKKDVFTAYLNFRYGLARGWQVDLRIPYMYRRDRYAWKENSVTREKTVTDSALGDISFGVSYQFLYEKGSLPDAVLNLKIKTRTGKDPYDIETDDRGRPEELPTGNGHWGVSVGITLVKRSDPAVLFGSVAYFYNFERDIGGYGKVKPGASIDFSLGMAYALNERFSTNIFYDQKIYARTEVDGEKQADTDFNVAMLYWGASYVLSPRTSINFSVGVGLTDDAPDVTLEIRLPIKF